MNSKLKNTICVSFNDLDYNNIKTLASQEGRTLADMVRRLTTNNLKGVKDNEIAKGNI